MRVRTLLTWLFLLLAGCAGPGAAVPVPTRAPLAAVPSRTVPAAPLPATFTPAPDATATPPPTPTPRPSPTPLATSTLPPSPTATSAAAGGPVTAAGPPSRTACDGTGYIYRGSFPSHYGWRRYSAYVPPCYGHDGRAYPVIYLLHGSIQSDSHWLDLGAARLMDEGIATGRFPPAILIMPYHGELGNMTSGGPNSIEGITVSHLLPYVDRTFCTWAGKAGRSIGGISRGGYWALEIAFRNPGLFRGVAGHSSHLRFETDAPEYNPLATYAHYNVGSLRIWLDWGETDFLRPGQEQLRDRLAAAGVGHTALVNPGGHSDAYWAAHLDRYLGWHLAPWPAGREAYSSCRG